VWAEALCAIFPIPMYGRSIRRRPLKIYDLERMLRPYAFSSLCQAKKGALGPTIHRQNISASIITPKSGAATSQPRCPGSHAREAFFGRNKLGPYKRSSKHFSCHRNPRGLTFFGRNKLGPYKKSPKYFSFSLDPPATYLVTHLLRVRFFLR